MKLPNTKSPSITEKKRNGNGTGDPGAGTQAVFCLFTIYPLGHSNSFGIQPSPASFIVNPVGQISPIRIHYRVSFLGSNFSGQY